MARIDIKNQIFKGVRLGMLGILFTQVNLNPCFAASNSEIINGETSLPAAAAARENKERSNNFLDDELFTKLYQTYFSNYSTVIQANFTMTQLKALRRAGLLTNSNYTDVLNEQFTKEYFSEIRLNLHDDQTRLINHSLSKGDREQAEKTLTTDIIDHLDEERTRLESEAQKPKLKLARLKAWEEKDKTHRVAHQSTGDNNLHAAIDRVTSILQSSIFFPDFTKKFAIYLQQIKNIHKDSSLSEAEKRDKLKYISNDIKEIVPRLNAYNKAKGYSKAKRVAKVKEEIENLNLERLSSKIDLDLDVFQVLREALTDQLKVPEQPIKSQLAHMLKSKKDGIQKSDHELDYLRRRMEMTYYGETPKDYRADFFQFIRNEKSFLNEDVLGSFVTVSGGTFEMGSPQNEAGRPKPDSSGRDPELQHMVSLSSFDIMDKAVSQYTYASIMGNNPSHFKKRKHCTEKGFKKILVKGKKIAICQDFPVEKVSWQDANTFVAKVNSELEDSDFSFRLPTEAEFEYAARGGTTTAYVSGENSSELNLYMDFDFLTPYSVEAENKSSNNFRIYRSGVWEWTQDWFGAYSTSQEINPQGATSGHNKVLRGGS
ncbi:MAG: formylglycine-generating enzyme family protein, partial [Bdellovibrionia bacterium]